MPRKQQISRTPPPGRPVSHPLAERLNARADSTGMTGAYRPADHRKEQYQGFFGRIQRLWDRAMHRPDPARTTEQGSSGAASPSSYAFQLYSLRYERRNLIRDARQIYDDDPRAFRACNKFAREAVRSGVTITVTTGGRGEAGGRARVARECATDVQRLFNERGKCLSWATMLVVEGDSFLQGVLAGDRLVAIKRMPAASMERLTDDADEYINAAEAFAQLDILTNQEVARFPAALMWHGRWNHIDGERYGRSELLSVRRIRALLELEEEAQVRRRIARAPQRIVWNVGDKENPGDKTDVSEFKAKNGFVEGDRDPLDPQEVTRDFFGNGLLSASVLEGDSKVHEIDDIRYLQDVYAVGLPTPKALYSLDSESINRDVLEDQRAEWLKETKTLSDAMADGARFFMDLALLARGVLPESVAYTVHFSESSIESPTEIVERVLKARQNTVGGKQDGYPDPLISHRRAVQMVAELFDIDDVDAELDAIEAEESERQEATRQQESQRAQLQAQAGAMKAISLQSLTGGKNGANGHGKNGSRYAGAGQLSAPWRSEYGAGQSGQGGEDDT